MTTPRRIATCAALAALLALPAPPAGAVAPEAEVGLALVLAVDVSGSMDESELRLQREGYAAAVTDPEVLAGIGAGPGRRIALAYVEWAGPGDQRLTVPWRILDGEASARAFARELTAAPIRRGTDTSISAALAFAAALFDRLGARAERRVIDISGDGPNTAGPPVAPVRDAVVARGLTVNGLPLMIHPAPVDAGKALDLEAYFRDCVTGGPGSFVLPVQESAGIVQGIRRKLVLEIAAGRARVLPAAFTPAPAADCRAGQREFYE